MEKYYAETNSKAIDKWVEDGWEWGKPISHNEFINAQNGIWNVVLTPQINVPHHWFDPFIKDNRLNNVRILGLASGGAQQMPIFAALGAKVTVLDYSNSQLESERIFAQQENYEINIIKADMSKTIPLENCSFDIIFHPISNCYVEDVYHIWRECFRLLDHGGVLLAGMDNGINYLFDNDGEQPLIAKHKLPYNPLNNPALMEDSLKTDGSIQFSHSLEEQIGGQLKAGLILTHLQEDRDKYGLLPEYVPQYILTRAIKP